MTARVSTTMMKIDKDDEILLDDNGLVAPAAVKSLYNNLMGSLNKHYPKFIGAWHLSIDIDGGIVQITNMALSGKMGFVMKITDIDPEGRKVMRHAGELLERYGITRKKAFDLKESIALINRNPIGEAKLDRKSVV